MSEYWDFSADPFEDDGEDRWSFATAIDERTCPTCASLDGSIFSDSEIDLNFPDAIDVDEETMMANVHANCRCSLILTQSENGDFGV